VKVFKYIALENNFSHYCPNIEPKLISSSHSAGNDRLKQAEDNHIENSKIILSQSPSRE
jgi:hypothetical protein